MLLLVMIRLNVGMCTKCHTRVKPQAESRYATLAPDNLPHHTDTEPNNELIVPLSH